MTYLISDNIVSPLGFSTEENFSAIMRQQSAIKMYNDELNNHIPYCAALMNQDQINEKWNSLSDETAYTRFEKMAILSIQEALNNSNIDSASPDTLFILSTTKGNIELIDPDFPHHFSPDRVYLWKSAQLIGQFFENPHPPIVISSACISGVTALITAKRLLDCDAYKNVIVCGADLISRFVMTGFQSLKGLSDQPCRPYDKEHCGLNLGEGAATIILSNRQVTATNSIKLIRGSISNDAHHLSAPSRTGEGLYQSIIRTLQHFDIEQLAFINTHGTATVYNDNMEAIAITRAQLQEVPVSSLKGYLGHTLGAAGVIETVLTAHSLVHNKLPGTYGFNTIGTPDPINVVKENSNITQPAALKTASGFGGCNATLLLSK